MNLECKGSSMPKSQMSAKKQIILFYFGIALASAGIFTLPLNRAPLIGGLGFEFLVARGSWALSAKIFFAEMKNPPTILGIETVRFFNFFSMLAAIATGIFLYTSSSSFWIAISYALFLGGIDAVLFTRLEKEK